MSDSLNPLSWLRKLANDGLAVFRQHPLLAFGWLIAILVAGLFIFVSVQQPFGPAGPLYFVFAVIVLIVIAFILVVTARTARPPIRERRLALVAVLVAIAMIIAAITGHAIRLPKGTERLFGEGTAPTITPALSGKFDPAVTSHDFPSGWRSVFDPGFAEQLQPGRLAVCSGQLLPGPKLSLALKVAFAPPTNSSFLAKNPIINQVWKSDTVTGTAYLDAVSSAVAGCPPESALAMLRQPSDPIKLKAVCSAPDPVNLGDQRLRLAFHGLAIGQTVVTADIVRVGDWITEVTGYSRTGDRTAQTQDLLLIDQTTCRATVKLQDYLRGG